MASQYTYGYLREAVKAHLDLEEDELGLMNINSRFHIFANEAIQNICSSKPKYVYFQFQAVAEFVPLVYDNGVLRVATTEEQEWETRGLAEPNFASDEQIAEWYNDLDIYLVGQVIPMPDDFLSFVSKKAFFWTDYITNKQSLPSTHITYLSDT